MNGYGEIERWGVCEGMDNNAMVRVVMGGGEVVVGAGAEVWVGGGRAEGSCCGTVVAGGDQWVLGYEWVGHWVGRGTG